MENQNFSFEELSNIGRGANQTVYYGTKGEERGRGKVKSYGYYHPERGTYSILTKREYLRVFKAIKLSDVINKIEDIGRITILRENIKEDNMIMFTTGDKKVTVPAVKKSIYKMIGLGTKRGKEFLDRMIEKRVISKWVEEKTKNERYYLNPIYGMIGTEISIHLYSLFKEELDKYITDAARKDLEKLTWIATHPFEYEAMAREEQAKQQLQKEMVNDAMDAEIKDLDELLQVNTHEVFTENEVSEGYTNLKIGMSVFKEIYGLKAKLHMNKETATIDKINNCKSALDYFCTKEQNKIIVTAISKGFITFED